MCQALDIHHLVESYNCSAQSNTTGKLKNLGSNLSVLTSTLHHTRSCSNTGKSGDYGIRASTPELITDKAAFWTQETGADVGKNKLSGTCENRLQRGKSGP